MSATTQEIYERTNVDDVASDVYLTAGSTATAVGLDAAVNTTRSIAPGRTTIYVQARFATAAATCALTVIVYDKAGAIIGLSTQTATAGSYRDAAGSGLYWAPTLAFDSMGGSSYEVRRAATSGGNVTLYAWAV